MIEEAQQTTPGPRQDSGRSRVSKASRSRCPAWMELLAISGLAGTISFGGVGLLLADLGHYSAGLALSVGAVGTLLGIAMGWPSSREVSAQEVSAQEVSAQEVSAQEAVGADPSADLRPARVADPRPAHLPAAATVGGGVLIAAWNAKYIGHHVVSDRDPAVYTVAGKWIATHGNLVIPGKGIFASQGAAVQQLSGGVHQMHNGTLQLQFAHMLPALLADADKIGGDALAARVPALLGFLGLCAVYAVGCRLLRRPWLVAAAVIGLGVSLPDLYVDRDTFSEGASQVLVWGGILCLLRAYQTRRYGIAFLAGLAFGGALMAHIDGVIFLLPLALLGGLGWAATRPGARRGFASRYGMVVAGAVPTAVLGTWDVQRRATDYYDNLSPRMHQLYEGLAACVAISLVLVVIWSLPSARAAVTAILLRYRAVGARAAAWIVGVGLLAAWTLRAGHLWWPKEPANSYADQTMKWMGWYLGPVPVALAVVGLCILVYRAISKSSPTPLVVLVMAGAVSVLYLWNPNNSADQVWVMRRFTTCTLPLLMLAAGVAVEVSADQIARYVREPGWPKRFVSLSAAAFVAFPLSVSFPVRKFSAYSGSLAMVKQICSAVGPNSAVLFAYSIPPTGFDGYTLLQPIRDWCGVPAAALNTAIPEAQLYAMAGAFHEQGRTLWILGDTPAVVHNGFAGGAPFLAPHLVASSLNATQLEQTYESPPGQYSPYPIEVYGTSVP